MLTPQQNRRLLLITTVLLAALLWLGARLFQLQIVRHEELHAKAESCIRFRRTLPALRGGIYDRHNRVLAISRPVKNVFVDPCLLGEKQAELASVLAPWLGADLPFLKQYLKPRLLRSDGFGPPVYDNKVLLKRKATLEEWANLQAALARHAFGYNTNRLSPTQARELYRLRHRAIFADDDQERVYPNGPVAAHVVGYLGVNSNSPSRVGLGGLEAKYEEHLRGQAGFCLGEHDGIGREIASRRQARQEAINGGHIKTTLDLVLQSIVELELTKAMQQYGAAGAAAVMIDVPTGEVLALASAPSFNPEQLAHAPSNGWVNLALVPYEPGSVFKLVPYSAGLAEHLFAWDYIVHGARPMTVLCAFAQSRNEAASAIGQTLGASCLHHYATNFGFGRLTGIGLSDEKAGSIYPLKRWTSSSLTHVPIGYEVQVTPLQLVQAMNSIANEGRLKRPMLVTQLLDQHQRVIQNFASDPGRLVLPPEVARQMVTGLTAVVAQGTGKLAAPDNNAAAGKTGTAQKAKERPADCDPKDFHGGYEPGKYRATFCGFVPASSPKFGLVVMLDQPTRNHLASQTAAPTFRNISERAAAYLRLPPDPLPSLQVKPPRAVETFAIQD